MALDFDSPRDMQKLGDEIPFQSCWWNLEGVFERSCHFIHLSPIFTNAWKHFLWQICHQNHRSVGTAMISTYLNIRIFAPGAVNAEFSDGQWIP